MMWKGNETSIKLLRAGFIFIEENVDSYSILLNNTEILKYIKDHIDLVATVSEVSDEAEDDKSMKNHRDYKYTMEQE